MESLNPVVTLCDIGYLCNRSNRVSPRKFYPKRTTMPRRIASKENENLQQDYIMSRKAADAQIKSRLELTRRITKKKIKYREESSSSEEIEMKNEAVKEEEMDLSDQENEYEEMLKRRRQEKMAFLESLNIDEAKEDLMKSVVSVKPRISKPKAACTKKTIKKMPARKSPRLHKIAPDLKGLPSPVLQVQPELEIYPPKPPGPLLFKDVLLQGDRILADTFVKEVCPLAEEKYPEIKEKPLSKYESEFASMKINASQVAKMVTKNVFSLAIHPSSTKILIAVGSKWGQIGFWDLNPSEGQDGIYLFDPHSGRVSSLAFNPDNPCELYSSSFDGTLRCCNLIHSVFDEVYRSSVDEEISCSSFDFLSPSSFLVSHRDGTVAIVDKRTSESRGEKHHRTHYCILKAIGVHPVQKNYFLAAGSNGIVSLWDTRYLKQSSVRELHHNKSVNSAYFSPLTGKHILTTSMDDKLNVFDSENLSEITRKTVIKHNNFTGRWLSTFRAVWLPNNEDAFVVGSMLHPRRIEVYHVNGKLVHNFYGEDLGSVCSINAFHTSKPVLAGGNSSGRVHVFMSRNE